MRDEQNWVFTSPAPSLHEGRSYVPKSHSSSSLPPRQSSLSLGSHKGSFVRMGPGWFPHTLSIPLSIVPLVNSLQITQFKYPSVSWQDVRWQSPLSDANEGDSRMTPRFSALTITGLRFGSSRMRKSINNLVLVLTEMPLDTHMIMSNMQMDNGV